MAIGTSSWDQHRWRSLDYRHFCIDMDRIALSGDRIFRLGVGSFAELRQNIPPVLVRCYLNEYSLW